MLKVEKVSKRFVDASGTLDVLEEVSLVVPTGGLVSLVGPTGCGKTTLIRIAARLEAPTSGTVTCGDGSGENPGRVGVVFQQPTLLPWRSLHENVRLPLELAGADPAERERAVEEVIHSVGLSGFERYRPIRMSGGMQARAALARALVQRPPILLLDETFSPIDEITRSTMHALLVRLLAQYRAATLLITHSVHEAVLLSDSVVVLSARPAVVTGVVNVSLPKPERLAEPDHEQLVAARAEVRRLLQLGAQRPTPAAVAKR